MVLASPAVSFHIAREKACPALFAELTPLLESHYHEIAHYKDIPLEPDWDGYQRMDDTGILRIYTARRDGVLRENELSGYAIYFVNRNLHYKSCLMAWQDVMFVLPEHRGGGLGIRLLKHSHEELKAEGVKVVYQHVKAAHDFGPLLARVGYEKQDIIYTARLDGEK